jgi:hypothetical protein
MEDIRVEFIPDKSNPPPLKTNNSEARRRNKSLREEIKLILDIIKIGQSLKVYGLPYSKVSSTVHGLAKDKGIGLTFRDYTEKGYVQIWRSA